MPIIKNCTRAQFAAKNEAVAFLDKCKEYKVKKLSKASFDVTNRRLKVLFADFEKIKENAENAKGDTIEAFLEKVSEFLKEDEPSWGNIKSAYDLCRAKGFDKNGTHENTIKSKPKDSSIKFDVCDAIENFLANMS